MDIQSKHIENIFPVLPRGIKNTSGFSLWSLKMTRKIGCVCKNTSAVHKAMLKGSWIGSKTNKVEVFENETEIVKLMCNCMKYDLENVLKENSGDKNAIANLNYMQLANDVKMKNKFKKLTKKLYGKKLYKIDRLKSSKTTRLFRFIRLPYGCIWNGKEGRFAIRVCSPKLENELVFTSQDATKKGRIRSHVENVDKHTFENVCKEHLYENGSGKLKNLMYYENGLMQSENQFQHEENDLCDKFSYKNVKQITKMVSPHRTVNLPYGCVWTGKEGRFAVRMVSSKANSVETKRCGEPGSLRMVASLPTTTSYR